MKFANRIMTFNLINPNTELNSFGIARTIKNGVNAIKNAVFYLCKCPTALSGRSKRESGAPDSSACPAGLRPFCVYRRILYPPA